MTPAATFVVSGDGDGDGGGGGVGVGVGGVAGFVVGAAAGEDDSLHFT